MCNVEAHSALHDSYFDNYRMFASDFIHRHNLADELRGKSYLVFENGHHRTNIVIAIKDSTQFNIYYSTDTENDRVSNMTLPLSTKQLDSFFSFVVSLSKRTEYLNRETYTPINYYIGVWNESHSEVTEWDYYNYPDNAHLPTNIYIFYWIMLNNHQDSLPVPEGVVTGRGTDSAAQPILYGGKEPHPGTAYEAIKSANPGTTIKTSKR